MAVTGTSLATSLIFNGLVALVCFVIFSVLRSYRYSARFYSPKRFDTSRVRKPRKVPPGFLRWVPFTCRYDENEIINVCGLDTAVFLRLLKLGMWLFFWVSLWVMAVVVPVNATGNYLGQASVGNPAPLCANGQAPTCRGTGSGGKPGEPVCIKPSGMKLSPENCRRIDALAPSSSSSMGFSVSCGIGLEPTCADGSTPQCSTNRRPISSKLDIISLSNVAPGSHRMWLHLTSTYLLSFLTLKLLWGFSRDVALLRVKFLATLPRGGQSYSVLITDLPGMPYGTLPHRLHQMLNSTIGRLVPQFLHSTYGNMMAATLGKDLDKRQKAGHLGGPDTHHDPTGLDTGNGGTRENQQTARRDYIATSKVVDRSYLVNNWEVVQQKLSQGMALQGVVSEEMQGVYGPQNLAAVSCVYDQDELGPLVVKYERAKRQLEDLVDDYTGTIRKRKKVKRRKKMTVIGPLWGQWATDKYGPRSSVDALQFLPEALRQLMAEIHEAQQRARRDPPLGAAFVTFQNRLTACQVSTALHCHNEAYWRMQQAPGPGDIVWSNLGLRTWERSLRSHLIWGLFVLIVLFYLPVTAIIQAPVNVENARDIPGLKVLVDLPVIRQIIEGVLPSLVLVIFLALLPKLLAFMSRKQGLIAESHIDRAVVNKYFIFLFFALFVFTFLSGSALSQLETILDDPSHLVQLLGVAAPQQAGFFMTFILLRGLAGAAVGLLRISGLVIFWMSSKLAATQRAKRRLWANQETRFGPLIPNHSLVLALGLIFCCINPLIAPITLLYFINVNVVERYQMIYVYDHGYEAAGNLWREEFHQVMVAVYTFQVVMAALLGIKKFVFTPLMVPLPVLTFMFHRGVMSAMSRPWSLMSTQEAAYLDHWDAESRKGVGLRGFTEVELADVQDEYQSPFMKVEDLELQQVLREAQDVDEVLRRMEKGERAADIEGGGNSGGEVDKEPEDP